MNVSLFAAAVSVILGAAFAQGPSGTLRTIDGRALTGRLAVAADGKATLTGAVETTELAFADVMSFVRADAQRATTNAPHRVWLRSGLELPAATLMLKVRTYEEALGWAERFGKILGDAELELGKVNEPWDIGLMPPPENPPLQMLLLEIDQHGELLVAALKPLDQMADLDGHHQHGQALSARLVAPHRGAGGHDPLA